MNQTELANIALGHLGMAKITDINERSPQAEHCRRMWNLVRDGLLRQRHWNFALEDVVLTRLTTDPPFGWACAFALPADYILAVEVNGNRAGTGEAAFEIKGNRLLTEDETADLTYVRRVDQVGLWDASFCEAFCFRLAAAIAPAITTSQGTAEKLFQQGEIALQKAYGPDNLETKPRSILAHSNSSWAAARYGYQPTDQFPKRRSTTPTVPVPTPTLEPPARFIVVTGNVVFTYNGLFYGLPAQAVVVGTGTPDGQFSVVTGNLLFNYKGVRYSIGNVVVVPTPTGAYNGSFSVSGGNMIITLLTTSYASPAVLL